MDATENDLPPSVPFRISGFPTLKFKPAGSREFIDYDGDRTLESLIEFVEEKAKNDLTPPPAAKDEEAQKPLNEETHAATATPTPEATPAPEAHDEL
jgi:protein disulfide-isomerase A1